jgi:hypothetical protein
MIVLAVLLGRGAAREFHGQNDALTSVALVLAVFFTMLASSTFNLYMIVSSAGFALGGLFLGVIPRRGKERSFKELEKVVPTRGPEGFHLDHFAIIRVHYRSGKRPRGLFCVSKRIAAPPGDAVTQRFDAVLKIMTERTREASEAS